MKKFQIIILVVLSLIFAGVPSNVYADAGTSFILMLHPMYMLLVYSIAVYVGFYVLIKGISEMDEIKIGIENKNITMNIMAILMVSFIVILILNFALLYFVLGSTAAEISIQSLIIITFFPSVLGFVICSLMDKHGVKSEIELKRNKLLKYSVFAFGLDIIVLWGWLATIK